MDVKRQIWIKSFLFVLPVLALGLFILLRNTGVREIHTPIDTPSVAVKDAQPAADDWPWWRGHNGRNSAAAMADLPIQWSSSENIAWKTSVPGRGHSSPCLWGERLFLTTADDEKQTVSLLCFDRESGRSLWQTQLHRGGFMESHQKNSQASSTPACDGRSIFVTCAVHGSLWVTAVDFNGQIVWSREAGPYSSEWGYGSSPTIHQSLVIVAADNRGKAIDRLMGTSWLAAMHRLTGEVVWRVKRAEGDSFGSPVVAHVAGCDQLLLAGKDCVHSYDPSSGDVRWKCRWGIKRTANAIAFDDKFVYASARHPQAETICIRADGQGDVTETHLVWRDQKATCDVPSPCVHEGLFYSLSDDGVLTCLATETGKLQWKKRLGGTVSSSPLIAGQHLYCANEDGQIFVVKLGTRGDIVAENSFGEGLMASPIVSRDRLYFRTLTGLYCLKETQRMIPVADKPQPTDQRF
ncbi:outer membrane protein assembly factor BamB family protein [Schlesneria paludicola]|uniref:outer membrane protein assembly factor BamB family protein n=1 Tax=Schlesneria paludicola TaxID=360056 RepID=UPI00029A4DF9|nr:PQQ-binding-like beta-propeller repeat protein [Schlesneria paludicola]